MKDQVDGLKALAKTLYTKYQEWSAENGEKPMSQRAFGLRLSEMGFTKRRSGSKGETFWFGLEVRP